MSEKEELRRQIDTLDKELLYLLNRRQTLAQAIGRIKNQEGSRTLDFRREEEVIAHLLHLNPGPLSPTAIRNIFREIISAAREIQAPLGVAFLGPEATFSHLAALKKFGHASRYGPMATIQEVFSEVEKGKFHYGVVPIENSTEGVVNDTLDLFVETPLGICGEIYLEISHDLVSKSGQKEDIEVIYTHPQAYGQCRRWLATHLPEIPILEVASTGVAAQKAAKNPNSAAIASAFAAPLYDLRVVERRIEDYPGNVTHFFVIGPDSPGATGRDKTSIIFAVDDVPGALYKTLKPLATRSINMSRIVSRPAKTEAWRYFFFVDLDGHKDDQEVREALEEIKHLSAHFKLLGSFPKAHGVEKLS
jgi:chorismate mutase/prephenate dehydratase|uniref:Bifunctional chorismate mutase/prephenate dehydratase n=1 Tax=Desulfobacca acetoxidans TaxID=60893 RepID=A0A7C5AL88_9BACT